MIIRSFDIAAAISHLGFTSLSHRLLLPTLKNTVHIDNFILLVFPQQRKVVHERFRNEHLDNDIPNDSSSSNNNTLDMNSHAQRNQLEGSSSVLNDEKLENEDTNDNHNEEIVNEDMRKDI